MPPGDWAAAMRAGAYEEAWSYCGALLAARDPATRDDPTLPYHLRWVWDGRPFDAQSVLVRCYHGLGDTLQFARFLPLLAARAARVTVVAQPCLAPLLRRAFPGITIHPFDPARPLPPAACDLEIGELPFALRARPGDARADWASAIPDPLHRGAIGLCHAAGEWDPDRSLPERLLAPIAAAHRCITLVAAPSGLPVDNPAGCPLDMERTAALVAGCAQVVTVDTMIAHLAGALGRPVLLLLKAEPDWRWNPAARVSDWYPATRLFPQSRPGDWSRPVAAIVRALAPRPAKETPSWPASPRLPSPSPGVNCSTS
ncbi:hypothetical protein GCM10011380_15980 [Sphingomonas metalli]|uniref:Glycosyltransferase family 9 protein n=2 Tax=Sphingomonas metalli TaxID=1779358 RepID=A0A916WSS2_9SPHN|nr:hypothetical protein GCM10011380_15980 [Sphingomonas metalli]